MAASVDVLIVGAGIAGSVMAHEARARGYSTLVFDPSPETSASRAALAIGRTNWHKDAQRERAAWSVRWYLSRGWVSFPTAVSSRPGRGAKEADDFYLIDPIEPLVTPDVFGAAYVNETGAVVVNDEEYVGQLTVVAAGPRTWGLLGLPSAPIQYGHTLISTEVIVAAPLIVHFYAPYHSLVIARVRGAVRLGSSMAKDYDRSRDKVYEMLRMAQMNGFISGPERSWQEVFGVRATHLEETGRPIWTTDHVVAFAGFGRCGYTLAPARAAEVLDRAFGGRE